MVSLYITWILNNDEDFGQTYFIYMVVTRLFKQLIINISL